MSGESVVKSGILKKRSNRLHQWNTRHFTLAGSKLSYKLKQDAPNFRDEFDLAPGCVVTQVTESKSGMSGKKLYSFWVIWPQGSKSDEDKHQTTAIDDDEDEKELNASTANMATTEDEFKSSSVKSRNLQQIVESEVMTMKQQKSSVEKQMEQFEARDGSVSLGAKVAAIAVGGVVVGALSAGIGLIPYVTVVGITAMAGGGAVAWQLRKPLDNRLILACDSMEDAIEWKSAIETQINLVEEAAKPSLPPSVDRNVISSILDRNAMTGVWRRVGLVEGMRIMEHIVPVTDQVKAHRKGFFLKQLLSMDPMSLCRTSYLDNSDCRNTLYLECMTGVSQSQFNSLLPTRSRRSQMIIKSTPSNCLLLTMDSKVWPKIGTFKVVKEIDDHADIVEVEVITDCRKYGGKHKVVYRRFCMSRFWKLDDDGVYLITFNVTALDECAPGIKYKAEDNYKICNFSDLPSMDGVITIAPRADFGEFEYDVPESLVTVICQVSTRGNWESGELVGFMDNFLNDHLIEMKQLIIRSKYESDSATAYNSAWNISADGTTSNTNSSSAAAQNVNTLERQRSWQSMGKHDGSETPQQRPGLGKRGVTTVQPGMEDSLSIHTDVHSTNDDHAHGHDDGSVSVPTGKQKSDQHRTTRSMLGGIFTSKNKKDKNIPSPPGSPDSKTHKTLSSEQHDVTAKIDKHPRKSDRSKNSEASMLRQRIAMNEYAVQRLSKNIRKKVINNNITKSDKHQVTAAEYSSLQEQQSELQRQLQLFRQQHVELTGLTYEQAKSTLNRWRSFRGNKKNGQSNQGQSYEAGLAVEARAEEVMFAEVSLSTSNRTTPMKMDSTAFMHNFVKDSKRAPRPIHWLSYQKKQRKQLSSMMTSKGFWQAVFHNIFLDDRDEFDDTRINGFLANQLGSYAILLLFLVCFVVTQILAYFSPQLTSLIAAST